MSSPQDENMSTATPPLLSPPNPLDPLVRTMVDFLQAMRERERRETRPTDNTAIRDREPDVESPPTFQNRQDDVEAFLSHVELVISAQPSRFRKEEQKIAYLLSFLRGEAFTWVRTYIQADTEQPAWIKTYKTLTQELRKVFGDPDQTETYAAKILSLQQTKSAAIYTSEFRRYGWTLGWDEKTLYFLYKKGLKPEVKSAVAAIKDQPTSLSELEDLAIQIDNQLFRNKREQRFTGSTANHHTTKTEHKKPYGNVSTAAAAAASAVRAIANHSTDPNINPNMLLDNARVQKRGPLSESEKKHRRDNNLCLYCGSDRHKVVDCNVRPALRAQAATISGSGN